MYSFVFHSSNVLSESSLIASFQQTLPSKYFDNSVVSFVNDLMSWEVYTAHYLLSSCTENQLVMEILSFICNIANYWQNNSFAQIAPFSK